MTCATVAVIVPAYNAGSTLGDCLDAVKNLSHRPNEIIVYVDGATDATKEIAQKSGARVIVNDGTPKGPAWGRNIAAADCASELILFVDADVIVASDALQLLVQDLEENAASAAFGSYDRSPRSTMISSYYANLRHHHTHQHSERDASTFWSGIGLIKRDVFLEFGGFDVVKYPFPSIEDVDLGVKMTARGHRIRLVPEAMGSHCKDWTLRNVWHTDIRRRAYPWSCLLVDGQSQAVDLNLSRTERAKAILAILTVGAVFVALLAYPPAAIFAVVTFTWYAFLNRSFFGLLIDILKMPRALGAIVLHVFYHIYATATYAYVLMETRLGWRRRDRAPERRVGPTAVSRRDRAKIQR